MSFPSELAALFRRDLTRLLQQLRAFPDDRTLWQRAPGMTNPAGNLALHLEGNLREYIGRQLGGVSYTRRRDDEFALTGLPAAQLIHRIEEVSELIPPTITALSNEALDAIYPQDVLGVPLTTRQFLIHLSGHFNYHLGQIDSLRRILTNGGALKLAGL